jgi:phage terminase Nu1 subunit (DNA packaging protein)
MEPNILKRKWKILFNELKERWPDLTQSDIDYINGDQRKLVQVVQARRHVAAEEAARDVEEFLQRLDPRKTVA